MALGLDQATLLSKAGDGADATIYLFRASASAPGATAVAEHHHESSDDISYVLSGSATVTVAGCEPVRLTAGHFLRVPAGRRHQITDISSDFMTLNVFAPPRE